VAVGPSGAWRTAVNRHQTSENLMRLVLKNTTVRMIVLPVEPKIFQRKNPREALAFHIARGGATIEGPPAEGGIVHQRPGIIGIRGAVAVELKRSAAYLSGKDAH
jgi:hypothetical protein